MPSVGEFVDGVALPGEVAESDRTPALGAVGRADPDEPEVVMVARAGQAVERGVGAWLGASVVGQCPVVGRITQAVNIDELVAATGRCRGHGVGGYCPGVLGVVALGHRGVSPPPVGGVTGACDTVPVTAQSRRTWVRSCRGRRASSDHDDGAAGMVHALL